MKEMRLHYPIPLLSRILRVSASGFYAWSSRPPSEWAKEEMRLEMAIKAAHRRTRQTYGAERLQRELKEGGKSRHLPYQAYQEKAGATLHTEEEIQGNH